MDNVVDGVFGALNSDQKKYLRIAVEGVDRMSELVEDLMASLAHGRVHIRINREVTPIADIVQSAVESIRSLAYKEGIKVLTQIPDKKTKVFCDPIKIEQVLLNLFRNSIKFTSRGGSIKVTTQARGRNMDVTVSDNGVGIPKDKLALLFEKKDALIQRTTEGDYRTSGLGLIIVKDILDAHDSLLSVQSKIGKGTNITFTLPTAE